jgi:hypothetical protein
VPPFAVRIKAAEALVDKDGVEADVAAGAFDDVGKAEGESQGRDERLAPERMDAGRWSVV